MTNLLRQYLKPYGRQLVLIVLLVLAQSIANLYLPSLNADIINKGVITGNTHYIVSTGGFMLFITFLQAICAAASFVRSKVSRRPR